jgi:hypothetical protein
MSQLLSGIRPAERDHKSGLVNKGWGSGGQPPDERRKKIENYGKAWKESLGKGPATG